MEKGLLLNRPVEALIKETKKLLHDSNSYYHKAIEISENISACGSEYVRQGKNSALGMLKSSCLQTIRLFITVLDTKDEYTSKHCQRVTKIALAIGRTMGLSKEDLLYLELAGLLHDIGKIAIPSEIINKEGSLTEHEFEIIKLHPYIGYKLINDIEFLEPSSRILLQHHERVDGKGYPLGLEGSQMETKAKVLAVADAYDAMTSSRPYRKKHLTAMEAVEEMLYNQDTQFDAQVTQALIGLIKSGVVA
ncbi:MAG: ggdef domain [Clostridia bacterium]|jgi:putative nucleotidyltransferase with HDIG domain|nr:ggdef domain [Clostridia bacterium]